MPESVKRTIRIVTEQKINLNKPEMQEGFPMRDWSMNIYLLPTSATSSTPNSQLLPASVFEKAQYHLHPTFGKRAIQNKTKPPFSIAEEGWGEFDMKIVLTTAGNKNETHEISHDLNFASEEYNSETTITFKSPKKELLDLLRASGPVPGDAPAAAANGTPAGGATGGASGSKEKRKRGNKNVDMERLADGLQKLVEEDLLHVVQLIHDHKTTETYTKNDVENGEFHVDLYTLPDNLVKMLWDYSESKGVL